MGTASPRPAALPTSLPPQAFLWITNGLTRMHLGTPPCTCKLHPHIPPPHAHQLPQTAVSWPSLSPQGVHTRIMVCLQQDGPGEEAQAGSRIGSGPFGQSILGPQTGEVHGSRWTYPLSLADACAEGQSGALRCIGLSAGGSPSQAEGRAVCSLLCRRPCLILADRLPAPVAGWAAGSPRFYP